MARIRTIKPDFFRHEGLQELELAHPGEYPMFVFAGLWGHCDKAGRFEWKPRMLKLDILPFLDFDMAGTLEILERADFVRRYEVDGKTYGVIDSFPEHQRIGGKEAQDPEKFPAPTEKQEGSTREALGKQKGLQEGKGREEEGNGVNPAPKNPARFDPMQHLLGLEVTEPVARDWLALRKTKRAPATETAINGIITEAIKASLTLQAALEVCCKNGWQGFEAKWLEGKNARAGPTGYAQQRDEERKEVGDILTGRKKTNERASSNDRDIPGECARVA